MQEEGKDKILAFDTLFTTNQIQMYKIIASYLPPVEQQKIAIYIKFMELQYTISFFQNHTNALFQTPSLKDASNTSHLFDELLPFCDKLQKEKLNQLKSMWQNFQSIQETMETVRMMKELFPEGMGNSFDKDGCFGNAMDMSEILNMFHSLSSAENENGKEKP